MLLLCHSQFGGYSTDQWLHRTFEMLLDQDISNIMVGISCLCNYVYSLITNDVEWWHLTLSTVFGSQRDNPRQISGTTGRRHRYRFG